MASEEATKDEVQVVLACPSRKIKSPGTTQLDVKINDWSFQIDCRILPDLAHDLILGMPWLKDQNVLMDFARRCLHAGNSQRHTIYWKKQTNTASEAPLTAVKIEQTTPQAIEQIQAVVTEFRDVFDNRLRQPTTNAAVMEIKLKTNKPVNTRPYRYAPAKKKVIYEEVENMLAAGVIQPSHSAYNSPIVIVSKKDGKPRFCVDYRKLNTITEDEVSQLPPIHETVKELGAAKIFTALDLKSGFWQIPLAEESRKYTAFTLPDGSSYEFRVMPFGLKNGPAAFQKLITKVLAGLIDECVKVYMDDIIIFSESMEDHIRHLHLVLERLRAHNLWVSVEKCRFAVPELEYLGHKVTADATYPLDRHSTKVQGFTVPKTVKQLRSFIGTASWLREYIPNFAELISPLTDLTKKGKKFRWTPEAEEAFNQIKGKMSEPLKLSRPEPNLHFFLQTDASAKGMGAVLFQGSPEDRKVIAYASAKFNAAEQKYHANEAECLAVVWALKRFRHFLQDQQFTLLTDSRALTWLDRFKADKAKLTRWALLLQEFNFEITHVPGRLNQLPDHLSRNPETTTRDEKEEEEQIDRLAWPTLENGAEEDENFPLLCLLEDENENPEQPLPQNATLEEKIRASHRWHEGMKRFKNRKTEIHARGPQGPEETDIANQFTVEDEIVYFTPTPDIKSVVVPRSFRTDVMKTYHDSSSANHPGQDETLRAIKRKYYWPSIRKDVQHFVKTCITCATTKSAARQEAAKPQPRMPEAPWKTVSFDILGPYPPSRGHKNRFILLATDTFSHWVEYRCVPAAKSTHAVQFIKEEICNRWGYPDKIITDNGAQFRGDIWERFLAENHISQEFSPIYHQRANPVERRVQELKKILRTKATSPDDNKWEQYLPDAIFSLRTRENAATKSTPAQLLLGYDPRRPEELPTPAEVNTAERRQQRVEQAKRRATVYARNLIPEMQKNIPTYEAGDQVLIKNQARGNFGLTWTGPHTVQRALGLHTYEIRKQDGSTVPIHIDDIRAAPPERQEPAE